MEKPIIHLYLRHFVRDTATLERYRDIVFRVLKVHQNPSLLVSMVIGFSDGLSADHRYQMFLLSRNLLDRNLAVHHLPARGCGHAFLSVLGQSIAEIRQKEGIICLLDADQFPFDEPRFQQQLDKLASSMGREARFVGLGLREHISLGEGKLSQWREIEEMFHALFVRRKVSYKDRKSASIPPSYKDLGDPVPGCYCFNLAHPKLPALFAQCARDAQRADLWGYAGDPYVIMLASTFSRIVSEIMPTHDNPPGLFTLEDIGRKSVELGKTSLYRAYLACVKSEKNLRIIQRYYPPDAVRTVQQMILHGLERSGKRRNRR